MCLCEDVLERKCLRESDVNPARAERDQLAGRDRPESVVVRFINLVIGVRLENPFPRVQKP